MKNSNLIYTRQMAVLGFILSFTYKVSRLPPLVSEAVGRSGAFLVSLYLIPEVITFLIVYRYTMTDGLTAVKDTVAFKFCSVVLAANFFFKLVLMYAGTSLFTLELLFEEIAPYEVYLTLILPVAYMAYKGVAVIARVSELCIWLIMIVLITNFIFIKANFDFSNNLPLISDTFGGLLTTGDKFFFWFGDFTPFLFVTLKKSKRGGVALSLFVSVIMIIACFVLMSALYGEGAKYISNFVVKIASFNQFASKLGRLDWTGMIVWLVMSLIYLSVYLWAFCEASLPVFRKKNFALLIGVVGILLTEFLAKDPIKIVDFALGDIRWLAVAANYIIPLILLISSMVLKRKSAKTEVQLDAGA